MAYTRQQIRNAQRVIAVGQRMKVPWKLQLAALETILVEANALNPLRATDHDSLGAFQQRPSQGWGSPAQVTNIEHAARTFFTRALAKGPNQYRRAGSLAQAVQVSAYPARYSQRKYDAIRLFRQATGSSSKNPVVLTPSGRSSGGTSAPTRSSMPDFSSGVGQQVANAYAQYLAGQSQTTPPPSTLPGPPSFSQSYLPNSSYLGVQPSSSWEPPAPKNTGLAELLAGIAGLTGGQSLPAGQNVVTSPRSRSNTQQPPRGRTPAPRGRVAIAPGADRAGVGTHARVTAFLNRVSAIAGVPITVTTGTNHNQFVIGTRRQSDHWRGNAADIAVPVDSARGDRIASAALIALGVPKARATQMARSGGLWTLRDPQTGRRAQVIWKTNQGGNHHNHVHLGLV